MPTDGQPSTVVIGNADDLLAHLGEFGERTGPYRPAYYRRTGPDRLAAILLHEHHRSAELDMQPNCEVQFQGREQRTQIHGDVLFVIETRNGRGEATFVDPTPSELQILLKDAALFRANLHARRRTASLIR